MQQGGIIWEAEHVDLIPQDNNQSENKSTKWRVKSFMIHREFSNIFRIWIKTTETGNPYLSYFSFIDTTGWLKETSMTTFFAVSSQIKAENYTWNLSEDI